MTTQSASKYSPILLVGFCLFAGCSNKPGALTMQIKPASAAFPADEPIRLNCELRAGKEPVCLSRNRWFDVELSRVDKGGPIIATRRPGEAVVRCGTGIAETMILMPWLVGAACLDVSDVGGRYDVVAAGEKRTHELLVWPDNVEADFVRLACDEDRGQRSDGGNRLPPGEYDVTVRLRNDRATCGDFLPHPIGWKPYDQPVEATTQIRIIETSAPAPQAATITTEAAAPATQASARLPISGGQCPPYGLCNGLAADPTDPLRP